MKIYKARQLRNSGEAFRRFRSASLSSGAHEMLLTALRHRLTGAFIALMGALGLVGWWLTFGPLP